MDENEVDINDRAKIDGFISSIGTQDHELVLTSGAKTLGAILTAEQYEWFLDQIDAQQDLSFIRKRQDDRDGAVSLEDFKKELNGE